MNHIADNIRLIENRIQAIAEDCGRNAEHIRLVAVSKKQTPEKIQAALESGHRVFGENRVQEALEHWRDIKDDYPDIELHLIGPLQTNKVKHALDCFDLIQSVDSLKLAIELEVQAAKQNKNIDILLQVNTAGEE